MTHVLSDAVGDYDDYVSDSLNGYPLPYVITLWSLLITAVMERYLVEVLRKAQRQQTTTVSSQPPSL